MTVVIIDSFEVTLYLVSLDNFLDHIFRLDPQVEHLSDLFWWQLPELLRTERKMRHVGGFDAFLLHVLFGPLYELNAVHARHLVIDYDERHLVVFDFMVVVRNRLGDRSPAVEESGLLAQLELVK